MPPPPAHMFGSASVEGQHVQAPCLWCRTTEYNDFTRVHGAQLFRSYDPMHQDLGRRVLYTAYRGYVRTRGQCSRVVRVRTSVYVHVGSEVELLGAFPISIRHIQTCELGVEGGGGGMNFFS